VAFLSYYPAKRLTFGNVTVPWICAFGIPSPICTQSVTSRTLIDEIDLGRLFGSTTAESCEVTSQGTVASGDDVDDGDSPVVKSDSTRVEVSSLVPRLAMIASSMLVTVITTTLA
jgi:hypothetical protein